jgi:glyoxylase-like metal-dependent hydrolase (beta-lactamase superfamily II)
MHALDAAMVEAGRGLRPTFQATPGPINRLIFRSIMAQASRTMEAAAVEQRMEDGQILPLAGGLQAIHVPGHCAGQMTLLWPRHGGVLFAFDTAINVPSLRLFPGYEDVEQGRRDLARLAELEFDTACFGHGRPIRGRAAAAFRRRWGAAAGHGRRPTR